MGRNQTPVLITSPKVGVLLLSESGMMIDTFSGILWFITYGVITIVGLLLIGVLI